MKRLFFVLSVVLAASMILTACGGAAAAPAVCKTDAGGCAVFASGQSVVIGMGAPMTGDNAAFGTDISQAGKIAITDAGQFQGFSFSLDAEDDGGTAEGGAAVANKLVANPAVVAIAGHIFSGATAAAIPIYEKASIPMMSPSATNPKLTTTGSKVFNRDVFTDAAQGKFAAAYLYNKLSVKSLAIMHDGQSYGQGLAQVVEQTAEVLGRGPLGGHQVAGGGLDAHQRSRQPARDLDRHRLDVLDAVVGAEGDPQRGAGARLDGVEGEWGLLAVRWVHDRVLA